MAMRQKTRKSDTRRERDEELFKDVIFRCCLGEYFSEFWIESLNFLSLAGPQILSIISPFISPLCERMTH